MPNLMDWLIELLICVTLKMQAWYRIMENNFKKNTNYQIKSKLFCTFKIYEYAVKGVFSC